MKILKRNKFLKKVIGVFLIFLGILGGFLPFIPGFVFFIMGLSFISVSFSNDIKKTVSKYRCHKDIFKFSYEIFCLIFISVKGFIFNLK